MQSHILSIPNSSLSATTTTMLFKEKKEDDDPSTTLLLSSSSSSSFKDNNMIMPINPLLSWASSFNTYDNKNKNKNKNNTIGGAPCFYQKGQRRATSEDSLSSISNASDHSKSSFSRDVRHVAYVTFLLSLDPPWMEDVNLPWDPMRGGKDDLFDDLVAYIHAGDAEACAKDATAPPRRRLVPEFMLKLAHIVSPF